MDAPGVAIPRQSEGSYPGVFRCPDCHYELRVYDKEHIMLYPGTRKYCACGRSYVYFSLEHGGRFLPHTVQPFSVNE